MSDIKSKNMALVEEYIPQPGEVFDQEQLPEWDLVRHNQITKSPVTEISTANPRRLREVLAANIGLVCVASGMAGYAVPQYTGEQPGHALKRIVIDQRHKPGPYPSSDLRERVNNSPLRVEFPGGACSGFLIEQYLITAGHCLSENNPGGAVVRHLGQRPR